MIRSLRIEDPQAWDRALLQLPSPHILQSWTWGAFKALYGWRPTRWLWVDASGRVRAAAQVLCREDRLGLFRLLYIP